MGNCKSDENIHKPKIDSDSWKNFYETQEFINKHINNILYCHIDDVICYLDSYPEYTYKSINTKSVWIITKYHRKYHKR